MTQSQPHAQLMFKLSSQVCMRTINPH